MTTSRRSIAATALRVLIVEDDFWFRSSWRICWPTSVIRSSGPRPTSPTRWSLRSGRTDRHRRSRRQSEGGRDVSDRGGSRRARHSFRFRHRLRQDSLREPYCDAPLLKKPFQQSDLEKLLADTFGAPTSDRSGNVDEGQASSG